MILRTAVSILTACTLAATAARAETYAVLLGDTRIGTVEHDGSGSTRTLTSRLDNTPLGVANGAFGAVATEAGGGITDYVGTTASTRKQRRVNVRFEGATPTDVIVTPESERTDLSDVTRVPAGVTDPVTAFGLVADARDCPAPFRFYDGRRAIEVATRDRTTTADTLICRMSYQVIAGPGHLSPLQLTSLGLSLVYDISGGSGGSETELRGMSIRSGPFAVTLARQ